MCEREKFGNPIPPTEPMASLLSSDVNYKFCVSRDKGWGPEVLRRTTIHAPDAYTMIKRKDFQDLLLFLADKKNTNVHLDIVGHNGAKIRHRFFDKTQITHKDFPALIQASTDILTTDDSSAYMLIADDSV